MAARAAAARRALPVGGPGGRRVGIDGDARAAGNPHSRGGCGVRAARSVRFRLRRNRRGGSEKVMTVRRVAHRAHAHVQARRKRFEPVAAAEIARITEQFLTAATTGETHGLLELLAPDVTWTADSGGRVVAARRPGGGRSRWPRSSWTIFHLRQRTPGMRIEMVNCNNTPADGRLQRRPSGRRLPDRDRRGQDHRLLRHPQSRQTPPKTSRLPIPRSAQHARSCSTHELPGRFSICSASSTSASIELVCELR